MVFFGFKDKKEKTLFNQLILVSGVGPKMAITILSGLPIDDIIGAILSNDIKLLSSIKGLGKKTAEKIFCCLILEGDKMDQSASQRSKLAATKASSWSSG